ncbi:transposase [Sulfurimonas sp. HSL-1716]|uniref:transposase n=1 Tax=Hydrocurvibacter sulfurireducens TaxID=3131937 RepID=UPI0031F9BB2F
MNRCIYCDHKLYHLSDGMLKCSLCKRKYSPKRINKILTLIDSFCENENALQTSKRLSLSYVSIHKYYDIFRFYCAHICENEYEHARHKPCEYEEYFYLEQSKRHDRLAIFDAHNFLTFDYENHIYTVVMPTLQKYKQQFINDDLEKVYNSEFARFKRKSRIIKVSKHLNKIVDFWEYFEKFILSYKGISTENFPLYLKEAEFKFNHPLETQKKLLQKQYFTDEYK